MRIVTVLIGLACMAPGMTAEAAGHNAELEARPLLEELGKAQYQVSRCMLSPVLAANGRVVAVSRDASFLPGDALVAIDREPLDAASPTPVIDILERRPINALVGVRVSRGGSERLVTVRCTDVKPFYAALRAAAEAAAAGDAAACADSLSSAEQLHGLAGVWLRLAMSCKIEAGRLSGEAIWRADYDLFHQRIAEAQYSPTLLRGLRRAVHGAARDLEAHGNARLAGMLLKDYAAAVAAASGGTDAAPRPIPDDD